MVFKGLVVKTCWFMIPVFVVFFALPNTFAYAENLSQPSQKDLEAWEKAQDYSLTHPEVAFAMYGRTHDATAQENAEKFKEFIAAQNISSNYFLGKENRMGCGIEFFIQGVAYGPKACSKALPLIHQVIAHYKQEYKTMR